MIGSTITDVLLKILLAIYIIIHMEHMFHADNHVTLHHDNTFNIYNMVTWTSFDTALGSHA